MTKLKEKMAPTRKELESNAEAERLRLLRLEMQTVAEQPHRRGDYGDMTDPVGVFVNREFGQDSKDTARRCWEAAGKYVRKVARLRRVLGIPQRVRIEDETPSNGGDLEEGTVEEWKAEIKACENAMKCSGLPGFRAAQNLILEEIPPEVEVYGPVRRAVMQLAITLGFL